MKVSYRIKFITLVSLMLACAANAQDTTKMDPELYQPVVENLIDSYLPKAKEDHLAVGTYHPMKFYVDYTRIAFIKNSNSKAWDILTNTLIPTLTEHVSSTYYVAETANIQVTVDSCFKALNTRNIVPNNTNVDFVLIFYADITAASGFFATCGGCQFHPTTGRAVVGGLNLNYTQLKGDPKKNLDYLGILIHEVNHALGFSGWAFKRYRYKGSYQMRPATEIVQTISGRTTIVSTKIKQMATTYFSCPNAPGIPVEDEGSSGSAGSHWETTAMGNDIQVAMSPTNNKLSPFTMQLLNESGFYQINWTMEEAFTYGKGKGCPILKGQCSASENYCTKRGPNGCFFDHTTGGYCTTTPFSNGCMFKMGYSDCRDSTNPYKKYEQGSGMTYGPGARCFTGNISPYYQNL